MAAEPQLSRFARWCAFGGCRVGRNLEMGISKCRTAKRESYRGPAEQDRWWESREKGRNEHKKDDEENI